MFMKKVLYSLMLSEDVVRKIDLLAHSQGTNRSNLVNQILAEYVSVMTPEKRINDIFSTIDKLLRPHREIVPYFVPNQQTMALKSSLEYKYRPTVKYEVELYRGSDQPCIGTLSVVYRTQSASLINSMREFFRLWKYIEDKWLGARDVEYALYEGKFVRSIQLRQDKDHTNADIAAAISDYIKFFDSMMKGCLAGKYTPQQVETLYAARLSEGAVTL